eukprot:scaffold5770_cov112-Skeletonema_dohrnii-CCMP3373.AAC.2
MKACYLCNSLFGGGWYRPGGYLFPWDSEMPKSSATVGRVEVIRPNVHIRQCYDEKESRSPQSNPSINQSLAFTR